LWMFRHFHSNYFNIFFFHSSSHFS
jgi:hypothetical protein